MDVYQCQHSVQSPAVPLHTLPSRGLSSLPPSACLFLCPQPTCSPSLLVPGVFLGTGGPDVQQLLRLWFLTLLHSMFQPQRCLSDVKF